MTTVVGYLITFLYILMVMFVSMVLESDSDSYDKESRKQKGMISACWIFFAPFAIIFLIIMIIKKKINLNLQIIGKMTQEHKELLLKDLCARLPYGVKVLYENEIFELEYVCPMYEEVKFDNHETWTIGIDEVKPYLFPLSSMTEEQLLELSSILFENSIDSSIKTLNWCFKNHFDIYGLIPKGLANDATNLNIY